MRTDDLSDYLNDPDFVHALHQYEAMMAGGPPVYLDADELTDIAEFYLMNKDDEERALRCNEYALSLYPTATAPLIFQARQYLLKDDLDTTQRLCDAIPEQNHREVLFLNAEIMVRRDQLDEAVHYILQRGKLIDDDYDYYLYDAAYIFIDYNAFAQALALAQQLNAFAPDWYKTWEIMADSLLGLSRFGKALPYINKMLDADPFSIDTWNWAAEAYAGTEQYEKAVDATEYALAIEPGNTRALQLKGHAFLHMELYEQAIDIYNRVLDIEPNDESTMAFMAYAYLCLDQLDRAEEMILEAEKVGGPDSPDLQMIYEQHANVMAAMDRYDEAIVYIDKAEALGGESPNDYDSIRQEFRRRRDEQ